MNVRKRTTIAPLTDISTLKFDNREKSDAMSSLYILHKIIDRKNEKRNMSDLMI